MFDVRSIESGDQQDSDMSSFCRKRSFQRQACLLSVMAAFSLGLALGAFVPIIGITGDRDVIRPTADVAHVEHLVVRSSRSDDIQRRRLQKTVPNIYVPVSFVDNLDINSVEMPLDGNSVEPVEAATADNTSVEFVHTDDSPDMGLDGIVEDGIYWGQVIEEHLPKGFDDADTRAWREYISKSFVVSLKPGCGRMQNRLVVFNDGRRACARYRQNTDQIQGELFSFYLGQLLNISNLAPSTASVIDTDSPLWTSASQDILSAQWKVQRPVVLTKWISDLEPAGIPTPFQPLDKHMNKFDVHNITLGIEDTRPQMGLMDILGAPKNTPKSPPIPPPNRLDATKLGRLVELAQWSDLIVFDYLIANLDRVVNNLYNYQWNADIMAAPAHNLAKQSDSQLLVFLDNESGLLHGYRLLKKYEAYHGLLLDNLCIFRRTTIQQLQQLKDDGPATRLQRIFEHTASDKVRDILPPLPEKSAKILIDRIDRVLGQVQKCHEMFSVQS
uniref:Extracellular serine/threonine protein kinase four-jointed n=1 Tax=Lutzomyia longipalpis TaxID=7200 RepID=A0A1B0CVS9_LUTLO